MISPARPETLTFGGSWLSSGLGFMILFKHSILLVLVLNSARVDTILLVADSWILAFLLFLWWDILSCPSFSFLNGDKTFFVFDKF